MQSKSDRCPACGEPLSDADHLFLILVPLVVWDELKQRFVRKWKHGDPGLN